MARQVIVLKFGGSVLRNDTDTRLAVHEVYRFVRRGFRVIAVVSAFSGETDALLARADQFGADTCPTGRSLLAGTGELASTALLALALDRAGVSAAIAPPWRIGLRVEGEPLDAQPAGIDVQAVGRLLAGHDVLVVPGFIGLDEQGSLALLGRGGSDLTALYIAGSLRAARCKLVKDVNALYDRDPADPRATRLATASWAQAAALGRVVQPKAALLAQRLGVTFEVGQALRDDGTVVGDFAPAHAPPAVPDPVTRVALLGCGVVGLGVFRLFAARGSALDVRHVVVRDTAKARSAGVPGSLLSTDPSAVAIAPDVDLVIDTLSDADASESAILAALGAGKSVVTASKAAALRVITTPAGRDAWREGRLRLSACVGGAAPMLERTRAAARRGEVTHLRGVLNGTSNYVLSRVDRGDTFAQAVKAAQEAGFAEADPSCDLEGVDALRKIRLLALAAWGRDVHPADVHRLATSEARVAALKAAAGPGEVVRQVAECWLRDGHVHARVGPALVPARSALGRARDEWNALEIVTVRGVHVIRGRGAGRWPTAEAVVGDVIAHLRSGRIADPARAGAASTLSGAGPGTPSGPRRCAARAASRRPAHRPANT